MWISDKMIYYLSQQILDWAHGGDWDHNARTPGFILSKLSVLQLRLKEAGVAA